MAPETANLLSRFGASHVQHGDEIILAGGIGHNGFISREDDIAVFSTSGSSIRMISRLLIPTNTGVPRPLLIGSSVVLTENGEIVIIGGAATCFSMGTFCKRVDS